jgi:hypothetical protein
VTQCGDALSGGDEATKRVVDTTFDGPAHQELDHAAPPPGRKVRISTVLYATRRLIDRCDRDAALDRYAEGKARAQGEYVPDLVN